MPKLNETKVYFASLWHLGLQSLFSSHESKRKECEFGNGFSVMLKSV